MDLQKVLLCFGRTINSQNSSSPSEIRGIQFGGVQNERHRTSPIIYFDVFAFETSPVVGFSSFFFVAVLVSSRSCVEKLLPFVRDSHAG